MAGGPCGDDEYGGAENPYGHHRDRYNGRDRVTHKMGNLRGAPRRPTDGGEAGLATAAGEPLHFAFDFFLDDRRQVRVQPFFNERFHNFRHDVFKRAAVAV